MGETAKIGWFPNNVSVCWMFSAIAKAAIMDHIDTKGSTVNCT